MADERLTDQTAKVSTPARDDVMHVVDVSNTTDNAAGSSRQMEIDTILGGGLSLIQGCIVLARASTGQSMTALVAGDLVIYKSTGSNELIIASILATVTTIPDDLRDPTKAANWLDTSAAL